MENLDQKIKALAERNDFATAERLLQKYADTLTQTERQELEKHLCRQRVRKREDGRRRLRRRKLGFWLSRNVRRVQKGLAVIWFLISIPLVPYGKMSYFASLSSWDGPPFQHRLPLDFLFWVWLLLSAAIVGLELLESRVSGGAGLRRKESDRTCMEIVALILVLAVCFLLVMLKRYC